MKLLYTKRSPYARKVRVVAAEKNIQLELLEEDLTKKSKILTDTNPLGKIPTLILDNGQTLIDSPVICEYLDTLNDRPILLPRSGAGRFKVLHGQAIADGLMDTTVALYMEKVRHPNDVNAVFVSQQEQSIDRTLKFLELTVSELSEFNLASIAAACALGYLQFRLPHLMPSGKYPKLSAWFAEFSKRPSMATTVPVG